MESSPKKPNTRFLIPPHWFWAISVLAPWKQRHNCSFKRLLKFPLQNMLIKGLYFVFSLWEGDEKLGYFLYFNTSFRDWCTDSTNATTAGKKKIFWWSLANFVHVRSPVMSSYKFFRSFALPIITLKKYSNRNVFEYIWFILFDHKFGNEILKL